MKNCALEGHVILSLAGDGKLLVCPVDQDGQGQVTWEPWDWKTVKELRADISMLSLGSPACTALLDMLQAELTCPFYWWYLAKAVLTPAQRVLFKSSWESLTLESVINNTAIARGHLL